MAGLYIHIPFCKQKCHYCDFHFSVSLRSKDVLLAAINKEILLRKDELNEPIESIYFGGGTPSLLSKLELSEVLKSIYANYKVAAIAEITLEANPDDLSQTFLQDLYDLGFNRLSIGVQSFFDADLQFMNRAHTAKEANSSIKMAQKVGFKNITIDLIYGIPGLTEKKWQQNLDTFLSLDIPHLSSYALTVEPKTALAHFIKSKKIAPLDDNLAKAHFEKLKEFMKKHHFMHYEVSNFAKDGWLSKHNTAYWLSKSYLGIGPSAHSFNQNTRSWNVANNARYISALNENKLPNEVENLTTSMRYNEYIMTGLRTIWGVDLNEVKQEFGIKFYDYLLQSSQKHLKNQHLQITPTNCLVVLPQSFFLIDGIIADLFWVD